MMKIIKGKMTDVQKERVNDTNKERVYLFLDSLIIKIYIDFILL